MLKKLKRTNKNDDENGFGEWVLFSHYIHIIKMHILSRVFVNNVVHSFAGRLYGCKNIQIGGTIC